MNFFPLYIVENNIIVESKEFYRPIIIAATVTPSVIFNRPSFFDILHVPEMCHGGWVDISVESIVYIN